MKKRFWIMMATTPIVTFALGCGGSGVEMPKGSPKENPKMEKGEEAPAPPPLPPPPPPGK